MKWKDPFTLLQAQQSLLLVLSKMRSFCSVCIDHRPERRLAESGSERLFPPPLPPPPHPSLSSKPHLGLESGLVGGDGSPATCLRRVFIQDLHFPSKEQPVCLACTRTDCTLQDTVCPRFCEADSPFMRVEFVHERTVAVVDIRQG